MCQEETCFGVEELEIGWLGWQLRDGADTGFFVIYFDECKLSFVAYDYNAVIDMGHRYKLRERGLYAPVLVGRLEIIWRVLTDKRQGCHAPEVDAGFGHLAWMIPET